MPNIEIHGFSEEGALRLEGKIFLRFSDRPYADEMVVTIFPTTVRNRRGEAQPFLRLASPCDGHEAEEILQMLRHLGYDVEHLKLEAFYEKATASELDLLST